METSPVRVERESLADPAVLAMVDALSAELAGGGYSPEQTFGYSAEQLLAAEVHLVAARSGTRLVGIAGIELQPDDAAELKRFYVVPDQRAMGVAGAMLNELFAYAAGHGVRLVRLETGDKQTAARRFYARHGFAPIPRFGPYVGSRTSVCMERLLAPYQR